MNDSKNNLDNSKERARDMLTGAAFTLLMVFLSELEGNPTPVICMLGLLVIKSIF